MIFKEKMKTKTKKRNPADLTKRNNDARKKEIEKLAEKVARMEWYFAELWMDLKALIDNVEQRVTKVEERKK